MFVLNAILALEKIKKDNGLHVQETISKTVLDVSSIIPLQNLKYMALDM